MQESFPITGEPNAYELPKEFSAADVENSFNAIGQEIAKLPSDRQEQWALQMKAIRREEKLHVDQNEITIDLLKEILASGDKNDRARTIKKRLEEQRAEVRKKIDILWRRVEREMKQGVLPSRLEIAGTKSSQALAVHHEKETDDEFHVIFAQVKEWYENEYGKGVKFVVTRDNDGMLVVTMFPRDITHIFIAHQNVSTGKTLEGAGNLRKSCYEEDPPVVTFDSDTCSDKYGFDRPDDDVLAEEIRVVVQEQWALLIEKAKVIGDENKGV